MLLWKILSNSKFHYMLIFITFLFSFVNIIPNNNHEYLNKNKISSKNINKNITLFNPAFIKKSNKIKLSVVIPLKNIENKYIRNLISNLNKTETKTEIIFVGENEKKEEILKNYKNRYKNIKRYYVSKNEYNGLGNMILNGLFFARGEYIMILDENISNFDFLKYILNAKNQNIIYYGKKKYYNYKEKIFINMMKKLYEIIYTNKINIIDVNSNVIIMKKDNLKQIFNQLKSFSFQIKYEILKLLNNYNFKITEFDYELVNNNNINDLFNNYYNKNNLKEFIFFLKDFFK